MVFLSFVIGTLFLFLGGHVLVEGASQIARRFTISELIIGLTLVSIGTSLPEVVVNVLASLKGESDVVMGNILGSNISNTCLILGATGLLSPLVIPQCRLAKEIRFYCFSIAVLLLSIMASQPYEISFLNGILLLIFFGFSLYLFFIPSSATDISENSDSASLTTDPLYKSVSFFILGIILLPIGGNLLIDSAMSIATTLGISISFISLFAIALGTSLPELVTSLIAASRGNTGLALGNIIGSNIFNITLVLGISALINPIRVQSFYILDIIIMSVAILPVAWVLLFKRHHNFYKSISGLMLIGYLIYTYFIWIR